MIRINYPLHPEKFHNDYKAIFEGTLDKSLSAYFEKHKFKEFEAPRLDELLTANFEQLCKWSFKLKKALKCTEKCNKKFNADNCDACELKDILNYDKHNKGYSKAISQFFQRYRDEINLSTCYYCNISYVHAFENRGDFIDIIDFVNSATEEEVTQLHQVGPETLKRILKERPISNVEDIGLKDSRLQHLINGFEADDETKKQFTLDHVLDKAEHPLVALSLYNFVPSCYSCNSQFKSIKEIVKNKDEHHLSPTSPNFDLQNNVRFQLLFDKGANAQINATTDFHLKPRYDLAENAPYENYLSVFRILPRYRKHKSMVLDLIEKQKKYSPKYIEKIAKTIGSTQGKVREDIFGKELFRGKCETEPFTKFKRDIAQNIKLEGAKTSRHGDE